MSFQDMAWAIEQECDSPGQKLVLLMLANHCNGHTRRCDPSHKRLAKECSMGVSTLKRNILSLVDAGLLEIIHRAVEGVSLPNQYKLLSKVDGVGPNWTEGRPELDGGVGPNRATNQEIEPGIEPVGAAAPLPPAKLPSCPHKILIELFGKHLPTMPQPKPELWSGAKADAMAARWKWTLTAVSAKKGTRYATTKEEAVSFFERFFAYVGKSDFLTGGNEKWTRCNLSWLMKADNFAKVLEGHYENESAT